MSEQKQVKQKRHKYFLIIFGGIKDFLNRIIKYVCICLCCYWFFEALKAIANSKTDVNFLISLITDLKMDKWISFVFGGCCIIYVVVREIIYKKIKKAQSEYIEALEKKIEQYRQNGSLNKKGETHENDR